MDYAALKAEIAKPDYAGLDNTAIVALLNALTIKETQSIPAAEVKKQFIKTSVLARAKFFAEGTANDLDLRIACQTVYDSLLYDAFTDLDPNDSAQGPLIQGFLAALKASGCIDDPGIAAVLDLANVQISRSSQLFDVPRITEADIERARKEVP